MDEAAPVLQHGGRLNEAAALHGSELAGSFEHKLE